jgi:heat shock protein HslJ
VEFRSSDDAIGVIRPDDPAKYTMALSGDGRVALRLDCNRANGPWSSNATSQDSGSFSFGSLAMTRALCPPSSLDQRIARDAPYVRSYLLRGGNLYLNLMADGGTYVWTPDAGTAK